MTKQEVGKWIIDDATDDDLNHIRSIIKMRNLIQFNVGDEVWFDAKTRGIIHGTITKMNNKTFKVQSATGGLWTVGPDILHKKGKV